MYRRRKLNRRIKSIIPVIIIPISIGMGIRATNITNRQMETKSLSTTESTTTINECNTEPICKSDRTPEPNGFEVAMDVPVSKDWSCLGNELPILNSSDTILLDTDLQNYIYNVSKEFNVPYELSLAVCYIESKFNPDVNNAGTNTDGTTDYGIMGLNDLYLESNCNLYNNGIIIDPYNAYDNIYIGIQILANNLEYFDGNVLDAANAYNLGINGWEQMKYSGQDWYYGNTVLQYIDVLESM